MASRCLAWVALVASPLLFACRGTVGPGDEAPPGVGVGGGSGGMASVGGVGKGGETAVPRGGPDGGGTAVPTSAAGLRPLARLTREQYDNTVRDLLGDSSHPAADFGDDAVGGSGFNEPGILNVEQLRQYNTAADNLAAQAVQGLASLTGCAATVADEDCARQFARSFGRRAYRRPLGDDEVAALVSLYRAVRADGGQDHAGALHSVVQAMLQSPFFLYHWELGYQNPTVDKVSGLARLNPYEIASRLSYFLWNTMPDAMLFTAAEGGKLTTTADVAAQVQRMLVDPKARDTLDNFYEQLLELQRLPNVTKSTTAFKGWDGTLLASMDQERARFVQAVLLDGDGRLETLLTADWTIVDKGLAKHYGLPAVATGYEKRDFDKGQRAGLLTQAAFLTLHATDTESHPVKRGAAIFKRILCGEIPPPPANVPPPKPPAANLSTRDRFAEHDSNACAQACHALMDPIGFGLENYDAIGRWRDSDGGKVVDASGSVVFPLSGERRAYNGPLELMHTLATSDEVRSCMSRQWLRFALGRNDSDDDAASLAQAGTAFKNSDYNFRNLIAAIATSPSFLSRKPTTGEVTQ